MVVYITISTVVTSLVDLDGNCDFWLSYSLLFNAGFFDYMVVVIVVWYNCLELICVCALCHICCHINNNKYDTRHWQKYFI